MRKNNHLAQLRERREQRGWSQQEVADKVSVTKLTVSRWENGKTVPHRHYRRLLCDIFQATAVDFGWETIVGPLPEHDQVEAVASPTSLAPLPPSASPTIDSAIPHENFIQLIGRDAIMQTILHQLSKKGSFALTTLNGLPGVGKTALATAISHRSETLALFPDGILWAPVGPTPNVLAILHRWGELLGLTETYIQSLHTQEQWTQAIRFALTQRSMLLVIDDVWQLDDGLALLVGGESCAHVITTRFPLIASQLALQAISVQELSADESCLLLEQLAPQVAQKYPEQLRLLAQAVGGLPLALTLIGNYLRKVSYSSSQRRISAALTDLMSVTTRFTMSEPPIPSVSHPSLAATSHISLDTILAVTVQRLSTDARFGFYALALFPAKPQTFSEEAALAVMTQDHKMGAEALLDELIDMGLVECDGTDRCRLHQILADYAGLGLTPEIEVTATRRLLVYATHFLDAAPDYERLDLECPTLYTIFDRAIRLNLESAMLLHCIHAFVPYLLLRGFYDRADTYLHHVFTYLTTEEQHERAIHFLLWGDTAQRQGKFALSEERYHISLMLARTYHVSLLCRVLTEFGGMMWRRGSLDEGEKLLKEAQALAQTPMEQCKISRYLGTITHERGQGEQERAYLLQALSIARTYNLRDQLCISLLNVGSFLGNRGNAQEAEQYYLDALAVAREIKYQDQICVILVNLAFIKRMEEEWVQAERYLQEGLEIVQHVHSPEWLSVVLCDLGSVKFAQKQDEEAEKLYQESLVLAQHVQRVRVLCNVLSEYGVYMLQHHKWHEAEQMFDQMLPLAKGDQEMMALALYGLAQVAAEQEHIEQAVELAARARAIFGTLQHYKMHTVDAWLQSLQ
ncbi:helix-turn-helix domain-containing protein [Ktedonobacteria bacterium brp13]|nr:helix-turn-helix domain-containing protein [Ktedonobacteria bacterium brp13]